MSKEPMIISSVTFRFYWNMLFAVLILLLFTHCNQKRNEAETARLIVLDSMLNEQPEAVLDSLSAIKTAKRSKFNRGYAALLQTIAEDKTFFNFTSDSLISASQQQLSKHKRTHLDLHARALMYQGLVRHRMGVNDSTAYMPLKDAAIEFNKISPLPLRNCYLVNYYLGQIHDKNDNTTLSGSYLEKALPLAKLLNDSSYLFATYRELFWNRMQIPDYSEAKLYLDTIQYLNMEGVHYQIANYNMKSVYYDRNLDFTKALELKRKLISLKKINHIPLEQSNLYSLSRTYQKIGKPDSAYYYMQLTIEHITDTSFHLNHFYYRNLAEITADMGIWSESSAAYQKAYQLLDEATDKLSDTNLAELEKKYDTAEAENRALRAEKKNTLLWSLIALFFLTTIIVVQYGYRMKIKRALTLQRNVVLEKESELATEKISLAQEKQKRMEEDKLRAERQLDDSRLILSVLYHMSKETKDIGDLLYQLSVNAELKKLMPQLYNEVEIKYKDYNKQTPVLDATFITEEMLCRYLRLLPGEEDKLSRSEKLLLMLTGMGASNTEIALLFNTTSGSIRTRKVTLRKKIESQNISFPKEIISKFGM